jgi:hypothetical protein
MHSRPLCKFNAFVNYYAFSRRNAEKGNIRICQDKTFARNAKNIHINLLPGKLSVTTLIKELKCCLLDQHGISAARLEDLIQIVERAAGFAKQVLNAQKMDLSIKYLVPKVSTKTKKRLYSARTVLLVITARLKILRARSSAKAAG